MDQFISFSLDLFISLGVVLIVSIPLFSQFTAVQYKHYLTSIIIWQTLWYIVLKAHPFMDYDQQFNINKLYPK